MGPPCPNWSDLHQVIAIVPLKVLHVHAAGALMEILVLDSPLVEQLRVLGILQADNVGSLGPFPPVDHSGDVCVRTIHLLLEVHIGDGELRTEGEVAEHLDIVAAAVDRAPGNLLCRQWRGDGERQSG